MQRRFVTYRDLRRMDRGLLRHARPPTSRELPAVPHAPLRTVAALLAAAAVAGCSAAAQEPSAPRASELAPSSSPAPSAPVDVDTKAPDAALPSPEQSAAALALQAPQVKPLSVRLRPDVLVRATRTMSPKALAALAALLPEGHAAVFRSGTVRVGARTVKAVGIDPSSFRAFAAQGTAESTPVWQSVARGEAVLAHEVAKTLGVALGKQVKVAPASRGQAAAYRVGAFATTGVPGTDVVVDDESGRSLGLPAATGMLLAAAKDVDPVVLARQVRAITGKGAVVDLLTPPTANPVAFLTGSKAAKAFGAFSYRYYPDGTIEPDARWVRENIRTGTVPIMGRVTCHRLMLPQLRGALQEVVDRGLEASLNTYDGCYVPRFIERNPENSISLHTWGIAIDMDASTNYRGIRGTMHPEVVNIFKRWGFRWGGDWRYTDPMHFEMGAILTTPRG
ncbi:MAG: hypothetical protein JWN57_1274 [Frankiales bacterium]|nr:hypothetical protein [Frankiales bacterium]